MERLVRREPRACGIDQTRWRLQDLLMICQEWEWQVTSISGMRGLLQQLELSSQRARDYVHSPDPQYLEKIAYVEALWEEVRACTGRQVALYLDEFTYYRQPSVAPAYAPVCEQPLARRSHRADTPTRVVATLDQADGRVCFWQGAKVGIPQLVRFYRQLRESYPAAEQIHVVLDNWPIHFHPDVLVALAPQVSPWPHYVPPTWPTTPSPAAQKKWGDWQLPIQLVPLPTYASWENPIEKLWRWCRQQVLHLHRHADQLETLRELVRKFLASFADGSQALLRYVGLLKAP